MTHRVDVGTKCDFCEVGIFTKRKKRWNRKYGAVPYEDKILVAVDGRVLSATAWIQKGVGRSSVSVRDRKVFCTTFCSAAHDLNCGKEYSATYPDKAQIDMAELHNIKVVRAKSRYRSPWGKREHFGAHLIKVDYMYVKPARASEKC